MSRPIKRKQKRDAANDSRNAVVKRIEEISQLAHPSDEQLNEVKDLIHNTPEGQAYASDEMRQAQTGKAQARYSPVLKMMLSLGGIGASLNQISTANSRRGALVQPAIPNAPGFDPALNQQIFSAQRGSMDAGKAAFAANVGINDAYNQAVQEATNTAAGQAGTRQSLINAANLRKMRASVGMLPELDAIRAREEGRADNLVGERSQIAQQNYSNQLHATGLGLDQYNKNSAAIGALGAVGHENLFGQLGDLAENAVPGTMAFSNPYRVTEPQHDNYNDKMNSKAGAYEAALNDALKKHGSYNTPFQDNYSLR